MTLPPAGAGAHGDRRGIEPRRPHPSPRPSPAREEGEGARSSGSLNPSPISGEGGARPRSGWEGEGPFPTHKELLARPKWMRAHPTEAERRLWSLLRDRRLSTFKFRRQQVIRPYIVDFACLSERLIIEADGSQHADNKEDARRDAFLRAHGFRILRFWNNQVLGDAETVAAAIYSTLFPHPPAAARRAPPSPEMGEGLAGASHA